MLSSPSSPAINRQYLPRHFLRASGYVVVGCSTVSPWDLQKFPHEKNLSLIDTSHPRCFWRAVIHCSNVITAIDWPRGVHWSLRVHWSFPMKYGRLVVLMWLADEPTQGPLWFKLRRTMKFHIFWLQQVYTNIYSCISSACCFFGSGRSG